MPGFLRENFPDQSAVELTTNHNARHSLNQGLIIVRVCTVKQRYAIIAGIMGQFGIRLLADAMVYK